MARLDSKDANNLLRGLGVLNEMLTLSMKDNKSIQRENLGTSKTDINKKLKLETETPGRYTDKQLVVIKKGQENIISQYNNFISMKMIGPATRLDLELSNPSVNASFAAVSCLSLLSPLATLRCKGKPPGSLTPIPTLSSDACTNKA